MGLKETEEQIKSTLAAWRQDCARCGTTTLLRSSGGVGWFSRLELFGLLPIQFLNHFRSISLNHFSHFTIIANPMRSCL